MNDTTYPLINLPAEVRAYCQANNIFHRQFSVLAGVSHSFIDKLVTNVDSIYIRRLGCIVRVLAVLGYTLADFDPRITEDKARQACTIIRKMFDRGCKVVPIASYLGFDGGSGTLYACLDNVAKGKYFSMAYSKAICLVHALEPEFESWCTLYAMRCDTIEEYKRLGGSDRSAVVPRRDPAERAAARGRVPHRTADDDDDIYNDAPLRILKMKHRDAVRMVNKSKNCVLHSDPAIRRIMMFKLMSNIGFDSFTDFCTYTDGPAPVITWTTETGLYRCEMTWDRFRSWFRKDGREYLSTDRDIRVWHTLSNYDLAYLAE